MSTAKFEVKGLVQGVGFRFFTVRKAKSLGLTGYAKNMIDGSVEVIASGDETAIQELYDYLKQGPERSYVEQCTFEYLNEELQFNGFSRL